MKQYHAVLFDLDGTLTDPGEGITKSVEYALRHYGISVADRSALYPFIGPPLKDSFRQFYGFSDEQAMEAVEVYREYFRAAGIFENRVYPGIPEVLATLRERGKRLMIASSKPEPFVLQILRHFDLLRFFDVVAGATMDEIRTNKADIITDALTRAKIADKASAVMVGDRVFDVEGAHRLGMDALAVTYGYGTEEELRRADPEQIARRPEEIAQILQ